MTKFLIALSIMLSLLLAGGVVWLLFVRPPWAPPPEFVTLIGELSKQKSTAIQTLDQVIQDYASGRIRATECDQARRLYNSAQTKFTGGIDEIRAGLGQGTLPQSFVHNETLDQAIRANQKFADYVHGCYGRCLFNNGPSDLTSVIDSLGNILIHAWEAVNAQTADRIETMRKSLNEQKWGSFGNCTRS